MGWFALFSISDGGDDAYGDGDDLVPNSLSSRYNMMIVMYIYAA